VGARSRDWRGVQRIRYSGRTDHSDTWFVLNPDFRETKFVIVDVGEQGTWWYIGQIFDYNRTLLQTRLVLNPDFESYGSG
jgi:hypothetical protein